MIAASAALGSSSPAWVALKKIKRHNERLSVGSHGSACDVAAENCTTVAAVSGAAMNIAGTVVAGVEVAAFAIDPRVKSITADVALPLHGSGRGSRENNKTVHVILGTAGCARRSRGGEACTIDVTADIAGVIFDGVQAGIHVEPSRPRRPRHDGVCICCYVSATVVSEQ